jgi:radical SAM protein with 4Fe4S-binding SPASM domain
MRLEQLTPEVVDRLLAARVANVTITGGEPFVHPELLQIVRLLVDQGLDISICTNAVSVSSSDIDELVDLARVKVNVSLDGYSAESHGRFRGNRASFELTLENTRRLADAGLLKGILSTPNALGQEGEYRDLYLLARELHVEYLLLNPLSSFGRGFRSSLRLRANDSTMERIQTEIPLVRTTSGDPEAVFIRFPNRSRPLTGCIAGEIFYVFVGGDTAVCPYLVFAARNPAAKHSPDEFIAANLFRDADFAQRLDDYNFHERYSVGANETCKSCSMNSSCGKGCPAAVIANGGRIGELDSETCPVAVPE